MKALRLLRLPRAELGILITGPAGMRSLNRRHRGVDSPTDVLSFPLYSPKELRSLMKKPAGKTSSSSPPVALGDIVINPEQARRQAKEYGVTFQEEMRRLLVHGLLHLVGYDHEQSAYASRKMRLKEEELLRGL